MRGLEQLLQEIDGRGYPAYKSLRGKYKFSGYTLFIDHVQGDPFASPSKLRVEVPIGMAAFPAELYDTRVKRIALQDYLLRQFYQQAGKYSHKAKGSGKSGVISVSRCGQEILERTGCELNPDERTVTVRLEVGFPANGRRIQAGELHKILFLYLPSCVKAALYYENLNQKAVQEYVELHEDQQAIRDQLKERKLTAFIANGAVLPRESGVLDTPMKNGVSFVSPKELEVTLTCPHKGAISGMGIPTGVTLIVGGGYHGKSTVLKALERGVYGHIPGDGREYVVVDETAMKIRAEDGRSITAVDISGFISNLPNGKDTTVFSTPDASGSTSQAANVVEAMEAGTGVLLIDEDTSATNFMVRDELMQRVVCREKEPIIPYVERVRELYEQFGISTILVAGSSGAYFEVADTIIQMDAYIPKVITERAKEEAKQFASLTITAPPLSKERKDRVLTSGGVTGRRGGRGGYGRTGEREERTKIKGMGTDGFALNKETVELRYVEQLLDGEQSLALAYVLQQLKSSTFDGTCTMAQGIEKLYARMKQEGLKVLVTGGNVPGNLAFPRKEEIYACVNRYRGWKVMGR